jgi:hypothetical protein
MTVMDYRTRDGLADYGFSIEFQPDVGWRVYIIFQPFQQSHEDSRDLPYQSTDDKGRCFVDWPGKLASLGEAKTVAGLWAELAERHLRIQQQNALYVQLIEHYWHAQKHKKTTRSKPGYLGGTGSSDLPDHEKHERAPNLDLLKARQSH